MLGRFTIARFALHNHSPTRERREILFAKTGDDQEKKNASAIEAGESRKNNDGSRDASQVREDISAIIPEVMIPLPDEILQSPTAAECAGFVESDVVQTILTRKERRLGIGLGWRNSDDLPEARKQEIETKLADVRTDYLQKRLNDPRATVEMMEELRSRTESIAGFARGAEYQIKRLVGLRKFKSPKLSLLLLESDFTEAQLEEVTKGIPGGTREEVRELLQRERVDTFAIRSIIEADETIPETLKRNDKAMKALTGLILEAQNLLRKEQNVGLLYDRSGKNPMERWKAAAKNMTELLQRMEKVSADQLKLGAADAQEELQKTYNAMREQCYRGEQQGQAALDSEFLTRFGISATVAREALNEKTVTLQRHQGKPVDEVSEKAMKKPGQEGYGEYARASLDELSEITTELRNENGLGFLADARVEQEELERWAYETGMLVRQYRSRMGDQAFMHRLESIVGAEGKIFYDQLHNWLEPYALTGGNDAKMKELRKDPRKRITTTMIFDVADGDEKGSWTLTRARRQRISSMLQYVLDDAATLNNYLENVKKATKEGLTEARAHDEITNIETQLETVMRRLLPDGKLPESLQHEVSTMLRIPEALRRRQDEISGALAEIRFQLKKNPDLAEIGRRLAIQQVQVSALSACAACAESPPLIDENYPDAKMPPGQDGWYDHDEKTIFIRKSLAADKKAEVKEHERGHAIVDIFTRRTSVFPHLMNSLHEDLTIRCSRDEGASFDALLRSMAEPWGIAGQYNKILSRMLKKHRGDRTLAEAEAEKGYIHMLTDELLQQYAQWKNLPDAVREAEPKSQTQKTQKKLFRMLERGLGIANDEGYHVSVDDPPTLKSFTRMSQGEDIVDVVAAEKATDTGAEESVDMKGDLQKIEGGIIKLRQFHEAYDHIPLSPPNLIKILADGYKQLNGIFLLKDKQYGDEPEKNPSVIKAVNRWKKVVEEVGKQIDKIDASKLDTSGEAKAPEGFFARMRFMSVMDIVKLWNDTKEDIKHIYKRRQDKTLKDVGDPILKALKAGKGIPLAGHYLDELHQYHERKYAGEEVKAADEWKEGLKNEDSNTVLRMINGSHNKDQVRGIIALLCSRGEMEWNDTGTWHTLEHLSGYHMPVKACLRDDVLRDAWLRKMIAVIWRDKELYYQWRQENDTKIESSKKSFEPKVDQLSNVAGDGMGAELENQLRLWIRWNEEKKKNPSLKLYDDVKPHLYEAVITYAIDKGKMTMEQKFYYLVQAVATGLLSIDRLRTLASTKLNAFPFIDYFYHRNNTLPQVQALARRLTEPEEGKEYQPGIRTTLWLNYEVAREKSAQDRLSKALSGTRAEGIDHEDIPFFLVNVDASSVDSMTGVISGTRTKISPEGAKNAYVGWNSKLKVFGALIQAEKQGFARVSNSDVNMLAQTLVGYIRYDNIITRSVTDQFADTQRLVLTKNQFESTPVSGVVATKEYRNAMTVLLREIVRGLRDEIQQKLDADPHVKPFEGKDGVVEKLKVEDFLPTDPAAGLCRNSKAKAQHLYDFRTNFDNAFASAIQENPHIFKEVLRTTAPKLQNEGGSKHFNIPEAVKIIENTRNAA
ncbi:hypothetical protein HY213_04545 [Candidatus Peregrinibacteria bacterium]|nr:hypothetical protein [Candidatus Peregrinibacteria bacterium]